MDISKVTERNGVLGMFYTHKTGSQLGQKVFIRGDIGNCLKCGKEFFRTFRQKRQKNSGLYCSIYCAHIGKKLSETHKQNISKCRRGELNPRWNGGKSYINKQGYVMIKDADGCGRRIEHRVVMEKHLGRKLSKNEFVHHINGIKNDNRIENLQVLSSIEHSRYHLTMTNQNWIYVKDKNIKCPHCENTFNLESIIKISK